MSPERYREVEAFIESLDGLSPDEEAEALRALRASAPPLHADVMRVLERDPDEAAGLPTSPVHAVAELPPIEPDTILHDRYEVIRPLGEGGMGSVYLARDINFRAGDDGPRQRLVAIKAAVELNSRAFLRKEASMLLQLAHPQIPKVEATFAEGGRRFVVMTYIAGGSLHDRMEAEGRIETAQVEGWMREVLGILRYFHAPPERWQRDDPDRTRWSSDAGGDGASGSEARVREPYVHRDLKPHNVVLNEDGQLYVVDLGIAQSGGSRSRLVSSRQALGTPGYAAPEVERQEGAVAQSDLYSVGMMAFVLLTGSGATVWRHSAARREKAVDRQKTDPFQRVLDAAPLDDRMREWIRRATRLEIEDRFESAADMLAALDRGPAEDEWPAPWKWVAAAGVPLAALGGLLLWASPWEGTPPDFTGGDVLAKMDSIEDRGEADPATGDDATSEAGRDPLAAAFTDGGGAPPSQPPAGTQGGTDPATRGGATEGPRHLPTSGGVIAPTGDVTPEPPPRPPPEVREEPAPSMVTLPFAVNHPTKRNLSVLINGSVGSRSAPPSLAVNQTATFTTRDPAYRLESATLHVNGADPIVEYAGADGVVEVRVPAGANRVVFSITER